MAYTGGYTSLGKTGLKVSRIAFGCGFRGVYEVDEAAYTIESAIEEGINFIDCANIYKLRSGEFSEKALGKAIKGKRDKVVITSKFGGEGGGATASNAVKQIEDSLKRLGTDYIDLYFLHAPDDGTSFEETVCAMDCLCKTGKILNYGLCNHSAWQVTYMDDYAKSHDLNGVGVIQNPYSLLNRGLETEMLPACSFKGFGVMTYSPIAAGLLSGAFANGGKAPEKSTWHYEELYRRYLEKVFPGRIERIVDEVAAIAKRYDTTSVAVAVSWVLAHKEIDCVIAGADSPNELEAYIEGSSLELEKEDFDRLERMSFRMNEIFSRPDVKKLIDRV